MAKSRTNRRSKSKSRTRSRSNSKSKSRSRSRSRSRRGGAQVFVGSPWAPAVSNMHRDLTAPSAVGNHFKQSPYGVPSGGSQLPIPEMNGPGLGQVNALVPFKGGKLRRGFKRSNKRGIRGGGLGFLELAENTWDNATIGIQNIVNGYKGTPQLPSASPWVQPELTKPPNIPLSSPIDLNAFKHTAAQRVATAQTAAIPKPSTTARPA